jgi:hypothetical protein
MSADAAGRLLNPLPILSVYSYNVVNLVFIRRDLQERKLQFVLGVVYCQNLFYYANITKAPRAE